MALSAEKQKQLDELLAEQKTDADSKNKLDKDKIEKMDVAELRKLVSDLVSTKRDANDDAKTEREKRQIAEQKLADIKKEKDEAELSAVDKLKNRDDEVAKLKIDNLNSVALSDAKVTLLGEGFPSKIVNGMLKNVTTENVDDSLKDFRKDYKEYKLDPNKKPDGKKPASLPAGGGGKPEHTGGEGVFDKTQAAVGELREHAEKNK